MSPKYLFHFNILKHFKLTHPYWTFPERCVSPCWGYRFSEAANLWKIPSFLSLSYGTLLSQTLLKKAHRRLAWLKSGVCLGMRYYCCAFKKRFFQNFQNAYLRSTGQILKTGTSAEILMVKQSLCDRMKVAVTTDQSYDPETDDQISCDTNIETITNSIKGYGQFSTQGDVFLKCFVLGNVTTAVKGQTTQLTLVVK